MKIYANKRERINELDDFIGQDIWVPVGFDDDDLYGWVKPISHKYYTWDGVHHYLQYKVKLLPVDSVIRYKNHIANGYEDDWRKYVEDYTFESTHFDYIDINQAVTEDELDDELDGIYNEYRNARNR